MSNRDLRGAPSAQHIAAVVEGSADAIITQGLDGTIISWNPAAERAFGFTSEEAIGQSIRIIVPRARQSEQDEAVTRASRGEPVGPFETVRQSKNGTRMPISLMVSPVRDRRRRIVGASQIARGLSPTMAMPATMTTSPPDAGDRLRTLVSASGFNPGSGSTINRCRMRRMLGSAVAHCQKPVVVR